MHDGKSTGQYEVLAQLQQGWSAVFPIDQILLLLILVLTPNVGPPNGPMQASSFL
jgi:hypothetical protein